MALLSVLLWNSKSCISTIAFIFSFGSSKLYQDHSLKSAYNIFQEFSSLKLEDFPYSCYKTVPMTREKHGRVYTKIATFLIRFFSIKYFIVLVTEGGQQKILVGIPGENHVAQKPNSFHQDSGSQPVGCYLFDGQTTLSQGYLKTHAYQIFTLHFTIVAKLEL